MRKRVTFYWRECTGNHFEEAVSKLQALVEDRYSLNDYQSADCQSAIEDRLKAAQRGRLVPGDHVKTIQYDPDVDMFEIRWADLEVTPKDAATGLYGDPVFVHLRLYYIETGERWVVGMHCHEKEFLDTEEKTVDAQNLHIAHAIEHFKAGSVRWWGVSELTSACTT